jgi:hypothetical protein
MHMKFLRLFLGFSAIAWGASAFGIFLSWPAAADALQGLGAQPIAYDRMLDYWLRMAAGAFTLVGGLYLLLLLQPRKYRTMIPWFGWLMVIEGVILLVHGIRLTLPPFPFYADTAACFVGGGGILWSSSRTEYAIDVQEAGSVLSTRDDGRSHLGSTNTEK